MFDVSVLLSTSQLFIRHKDGTKEDLLDEAFSTGESSLLHF